MENIQITLNLRFFQINDFNGNFLVQILIKPAIKTKHVSIYSQLERYSYHTETKKIKGEKTTIIIIKNTDSQILKRTDIKFPRA